MASATPQDTQRDIMIRQRSPPTCQHLPPELVISIFHFLYMDDTIPRKSKGDCSHKLLNLMLVCRSFNQLIQTTPVLWTELRLVRASQKDTGEEADWIEWIGKHVTKSAEHSLRIFLILSFMPLDKLFPIVLPTSPRWVHLTITPLSIFPRPTNDPRYLQPLFDAPISQLRSLSVKGLGTWMDAIIGTGTVFRHAPRLAQLEWHDRSVLFRPDNGETGAVKENARSQSAQGATYDFAQNTLEVLRIEGALVHVPFECRVMHRLRFLYLGNLCQILSFSEKWQLPVLEELHLSGNPRVKVVGQATPTLSALRRIEWFDAKPRPNTVDTWSDGSFLLLRVLVASPKLQHFFISTQNPSILTDLIIRRTQEQPKDLVSPFLAMDDATGAPVYCPDLQELRLPEAAVDELQRLAEIRPQLEKVEVVALRRDSNSPSPLEEDLARLERVRERMEVCFHEWV